MKRWIWLILLPLCLSGCHAQSTVGDRVIVTGLGITENEGTITVSVQAVEALRTAGSLSEQSESATAVYTASGATVAEALQAFLNEAGRRTYILQNQIIVLEESTCRNHALTELLDHFIRTGEGRSTVDLVVCRGDPSTLLGITSDSDAIPAEYVSRMLLESQRLTRAFRTRLLDVERASSGMYDAALPLVEVTDGTPRPVGTMLFRNGIAAGTLTPAETTGLLLAMGEGERCVYTRDGTTLELKDLHRSVRAERTADGWRFHVTVTAASHVTEGKRADAAALTAVEAAIAADIEGALARTYTAYDSDPLGLARLAAARYKNDGITEDAVRAGLHTAAFSASVDLSHTDNGLIR